MATSQATRISARQAAYLEQHEAFHLTCVYLNCYGKDARFGRELRALYDRHSATIAVAPLVWEIVRFQTAHDGTAALRSYADDLQRLARRWGLDQFVNEPGEPALHVYPAGYGYEAIHSWCSHNARISTYCAGQFGLDIHGGVGFVPEVGEVTHRVKIALIYPDGTTSTIVPETREPIIRVNVVDYWQPSLDPRAVIKARMMERCERQIDEALDKLTPMFREAGYVLQDTNTARADHARWLFRRVAHRDTCDAIAAREKHTINERNADGEKVRISYNTDTIQKVTKSLADVIRVTIPRPTRKPVF